MDTKNRYKNPVCSTRWVCSGSYEGNGESGFTIKPFRVVSGRHFRNGLARIMHGQLYGAKMSMEDYRAGRAGELQLLFGYGVRYSRNSCRFVMSRAARRRGYLSIDSGYNRKALEYANKFS